MNSINSNVRVALENESFQPEVELDSLDRRVTSMKRHITEGSHSSSSKRQYIELPLIIPSIDMDNMLFPDAYGIQEGETDFQPSPLDPRKIRSDPRVIEAVKSIIESEDKTTPYSDKQLSERMESYCGFPITERTACNLRIKLSIPDSRARQIGTRKIRKYRSKNAPALEVIKNLVESEDKKNPYSDRAIRAEISALCGLTLHISTVSYMRNKLKIPDFRHRKISRELESIKIITGTEGKTAPYRDITLAERL